MPNQGLFSMAVAAQYLGKAIGTIRKLADLNVIQARAELDTTGRHRRIFALEDLNAYIDSLEPRRRCNGHSSVGLHRPPCSAVRSEVEARNSSMGSPRTSNTVEWNPV